METEHPLQTASRPTAAPTALPAIRTPDQRVRVFVSSTLDELAPERIAAREAITQLRLTAVLFELGARPYPPRELYRSYLAQSDIFIGLYWQRYGWVAPGMDISGLEDEYQLAGDKPKLIYMKTPSSEREPALQGLLNRIRSEEVASYQKFSTPAELRELIANDLALLLTERFTKTPETPVAARLAPLPVPRSKLIDREQELAQALALLQREDVGLVTLTGPGGVGKTRLALRVAAELAPQFTAGAVFIELASFTDPRLVVPTLARALGLSDAGNEAALTGRLLEFLRSRDVLLVLDNAEQLLETTAPLAAQALEFAPRLKLLVTSREPLRVRDEQLVSIQPLALPEPVQVPDLAQLAAVPAVALFMERAREANPSFALTPENADTIVELCQRLDGLPLALELAAARLSLLTPSALLARLEHRLPLLTRGARDMPARQQTLRNTIAWSYDLLQAGEQLLFRRLSVFVGGFTLQAAQAVCASDAAGAASSMQTEERMDEEAMLEQLAQLLDKSLVQGKHGTGGEPRFTMLETIREYAAEQLQASGEETTMQERHAHYFLQLAENAEPHLYNPEWESWLEWLSHEESNLRAALAWSQAHQDAIEIGLRLAEALSYYWFLRGSLREGRTWLEAMLTGNASSDRSVAGGQTLIGTSLFAPTDNFADATLRTEEGSSIGQEAAARRWRTYPEEVLGSVQMNQGNIEDAPPLVKESHSILQELGEVWGEALTLYHLGNAAYHLGDPTVARIHLDESLRLFRQQGDVLYESLALSALEAIVSTQGDQELARSLYQQSLPILQQASNRGALGLLLIDMGDTWLHCYRDEQQAKVSYKEGLSLWRDLHQVKQGIGIVKGLTGLAEIAAAQGQAEQAGRLFGAAALLLPASGSYQEEVNRRIAAARAQLDTATFEVGWTAGQAMTEEQAISFALQDA
jgi:predicted ATPase